MSAYDIIISPILTEKTNLLRENFNIYVFKVAKRANKIQIRNAIKQIFNIVPEKCAIVNFSGKTKRVLSKKGYPLGIGHSSSLKKAYVYLKSGDKLDIF